MRKVILSAKDNLKIVYLTPILVYIQLCTNKHSMRNYLKGSTTWYKINHVSGDHNTLRPRQNGRHFADILKCIFLNENVWIPIEILLKFVPNNNNDNIPALVWIMAWRRPDNKPLSEPMMVRLPAHICVTRPQWIKRHRVHWSLRDQFGV